VSTAKPSEVYERFLAERRISSRTSILAAGVVAIVGLPAWSIFDHIVAPDQAWEFTQIRLVATALMIGMYAVLFTPLGRRRPEYVGLGLVAAVDIAIALMIVQLDDNHAAYALGMSLPIYASAMLLVWPFAYTASLVVIGFAALAVGWLTVGVETSAAEIATVAFYLVTASVIALWSQWLRDRTSWREFQARDELETEQRRSRELVDRLDRLSRQDALTGLANRRAWDAAMERECGRAARSGHTLAILVCDLDNLKDINDNFGHAMGDVVLKEVAALLSSRARGTDMVARLGGDEFGILSPDTDLLGAASLGEEIRGLIEREQPGGSGLGPVTVSIGCADWEGGDDSAATLMLRADRRLYTAKARRNVVCAGDPSGRA
jgi:diguanylate cyclase (GGDEF)-like protein